VLGLGVAAVLIQVPSCCSWRTSSVASASTFIEFTWRSLVGWGCCQPLPASAFAFVTSEPSIVVNVSYLRFPSASFALGAKPEVGCTQP